MPEFIAELYVSRANLEGADREVLRARAAAKTLAAEGTPVRLTRSIYIPSDETCLFLYEAGSLEAVLEAARRASLSFEHVAEATAGSPDDRHDGDTT